MNTKYYIPPISSQKLEETRNKLNTYIAGHKTKSDSVPLVGISEGISVFNRYSGEHDIVEFIDIIPVPEGTYITIAHRKFECFGYYYDAYDRKVPIWGFDLSLKELKQLIRADRKAHPKAYK